MKIIERIDDDGYQFTTSLVITWDNGDEQIEMDGGEPEDNTFGRDWKWIRPTIEKAYAQGLIAGAKK